MRPLPFLSLAAPLLLATSGCATFATNIAGDFECRAKDKNNIEHCQPASRIDAAAMATLGSDSYAQTSLPRAAVAQGDRTRSRERTVRIVFPAHVDEAGILHEEAVAWAVIDRTDWAARLRRKAEDGTSAYARSVARALKAAQALPPVAAMVSEEPQQASQDTTISEDPFSIASPLALPSTAREAVAGASAPAVEGFDMSAPLPHVRTPRHPGSKEEPVYPSAEAIDAAKAVKEPE